MYCIIQVGDHVKPHMPVSLKKRGPKAARRSSGSGGGGPRVKKEKPDHPRKRNTSQGSKKESVKEPVIIDPNIKSKKHKVSFSCM